MAYEWMGLYLEDMGAALTTIASELIKHKPLASITAYLWFNASTLTTDISSNKFRSIETEFETKSIPIKPKNGINYT